MVGVRRHIRRTKSGKRVTVNRHFRRRRFTGTGRDVIIGGLSPINRAFEAVAEGKRQRDEGAKKLFGKRFEKLNKIQKRDVNSELENKGVGFRRVRVTKK